MKTKFMFKQLALFIFAAVLTTTAKAQFKKGNLLVETNFGNISFGNSNTSNTTSGSTTKSDGKSTSISIYPRVGFFVSDNVVLGTELSVSLYSGKNNYFNASGNKTSDYKGSSTNIGLSPFVRYNFNASKDSKGRFFAQLTGGISTDVSNKTDYNYYNASGAFTNKYTYNYPKQYLGYNASILAGYNYMLAPNVALNVNLGYRYNNYSSEYTYTNTTAAGVSTTSPAYASKSDYGYIDWRMGFTMFIPRSKKK